MSESERYRYNGVLTASDGQFAGNCEGWAIKTLLYGNGDFPVAGGAYSISIDKFPETLSEGIYTLAPFAETYRLKKGLWEKIQIS